MGMIGNSLAQGLISGANIQDGSVDTPDIKDGAVHTAKVADGAVHTAKIADGAVTAAKIADGAAVPSQTGHNGKYLTTDGSTASWGAVDLASKVSKTGDAMTGDLFLNGDSSGTRSLVITEWGSDDYGAAVSYDAVADELYIGTRNGSTTTTKALRVSRGSQNVNIPGALTAVGGLTSNANLSVDGNLYTYSGGGYCPAEGTFGFNLESTFGLFTTGLLIVFGNENGVNQTIRMYTWNLSFYGYQSNTRYVRLREIHSNELNNGYGNVYAYIPAYAGTWATTDQSSSSTSSSVCDIYFRNAVGAGCSYHYTLWRT